MSGFNTVPFNNGPFNDPSTTILEADAPEGLTSGRVQRIGFTDYIFVDAEPGVAVRRVRYGFADYVVLNDTHYRVSIQRRGFSDYVTVI